jgi:hypothetical protein
MESEGKMGSEREREIARGCIVRVSESEVE